MTRLMKQFCRFLPGTILLCAAFTSPAQQLVNDSVLVEQAKENLTKTYNNSLNENLHLYTGEEYIRNGQKLKGSPFFGSGGVSTGSVFYDGNLYEGVQIYYDLTHNEIIIDNYANNGNIKLVPEKINSFSIFNHYFVHIIPNLQNADVLHEGFYDRLVNGKVSVYARREKQLRIAATDEESKYVEYNYYFIQKNNKFYKIEDKSSLLSVLNDKKDQLKKFIKANKLNFRKRLEEAIVKTTDYYIQLIN
ncbi:MAG: hypothetical protein JST87_02245 [Bacteroidetes bacterium]|nr:hypothetical protein [Bacteroidota bacterium]